MTAPDDDAYVAGWTDAADRHVEEGDAADKAGQDADA